MKVAIVLAVTENLVTIVKRLGKTRRNGSQKGIKKSENVQSALIERRESLIQVG